MVDVSGHLRTHHHWRTTTATVSAEEERQDSDTHNEDDQYHWGEHAHLHPACLTDLVVLLDLLGKLLSDLDYSFAVINRGGTIYLKAPDYFNLGGS